MEPVSTGVAAVASGIQAAKAAKKYADTANAFWSRLEPTLRGKIRAKVEKHFKDFSAYLNVTNGKASNVQLICSRSVNSKLEDVYVNCNFKERSDTSITISDLDLIQSISEGKRYIIRGNGGSGKTLFMKNLWRQTYLTPKGKIPIFIELRKFNDMADVDIIGLIRNTLSPTVTLTDQLFHEMATSGTFLIIFDGFDEVSVEKRELVEKQLLRFEQQYVKCSIALSSRPNETFIGWKSFAILDILPLTREQVLLVVDKTPVKESTKKAFKKMLTRKFFKDHSDFLTSPLLALMMLVTFNQKGDISDNLIDFYDNAFHLSPRKI